ncbi:MULTISPECIES: integrase core domain-containing protein [unclassified Roseateles]|uniref:integrase core domain-containing protein n=1 Tax=unclassified Roseateles TaxID=2626991 RepID=UPI003857A60C
MRLGRRQRHRAASHPTRPAYPERLCRGLNKTYRTVVLDCYVLVLLAEVRAVTTVWLQRYNHHRPHEALGRVPPVEYRMKRLPDLYF